MAVQGRLEMEFSALEILPINFSLMHCIHLNIEFFAIGSENVKIKLS